MTDDENIIPLFGGEVSKTHEDPESLFSYATKEIRRLADAKEIPRNLVNDFETALRFVRREAHREARDSLVRYLKGIASDWVKQVNRLQPEDMA